LVVPPDMLTASKQTAYPSVNVSIVPQASVNNNLPMRRHR